MRIIFCGTRGIPANYGGFETAVEEIARRIADTDIDCDVICRSSSYAELREEYLGCRLIYMPGSKIAALDTVVSAMHTGWYLFKHRDEYDHVFWFNNANLPGILMTLWAGLPLSVNTDGLEWRRSKWSLPLKLYYFLASALIAYLCAPLISDSRGLMNYYRHRFGARSKFIPYGTPVLPVVTPEQTTQVLAAYGVEPGQYTLQITRIEPENYPLEVAEGFLASGLALKHVVIGYKHVTPYSQRLKALENEHLRVCNAQYDPVVLTVLRRNCAFYVHGNSVGGTNPALLEAMACCPRILAVEGPFSREVLGDLGEYFLVETLAEDFRRTHRTGEQGRELAQRVHSYYNWDAVAKTYAELAGYRPRVIKYLSGGSRGI